jgi:hypothetical protein
MIPNRLMASKVYWEHVGEKRQAGGIIFDSVPWYNLISPSASFLMLPR